MRKTHGDAWLLAPRGLRREISCFMRSKQQLDGLG
jgi:hypothetical protein